ncbi:MAG: response regulator transcription factor [Clostridium sp.]
MKDTRIFLVEDDLALQKAMKYTLEKEGFKVSVASNVRESLEKFDSNEIDFVLLDIMLPDGSGYDICEKIRTESNVPIIFMTACEDEANIVLGLDLGGDDYITKPVRIRELVSRIKAVQRRRGIKDNEDIIRTGNLTIDLLGCKVKKLEKEIFLTAMEYKLLILLVTNKAQVLSRDAILQHLWDFEGNFVDGNTLTVYIKRLRDKVDSDESNYIQTIRGLGYKWNDGIKQ